MTRRPFWAVSATLAAALTCVISVPSVFVRFTTKADTGDLPPAVNYLPADSRAVFGVDVRGFLTSQAYAQFEANHSALIGSKLAEFAAKSGINPKTDVAYLLAARRPGQGPRPPGVVIAVATTTFNSTTVTQSIQSHLTPISLDYNGVTVLLFPGKDPITLERGIAFLGEEALAVGDLQSLKAVIDARINPSLGISANSMLFPLISQRGFNDMFWFVADPSVIPLKNPSDSPFSNTLSAIQSLVGTAKATDVLEGKVTANVLNADAARNLAQTLQSLITLAQLGGGRNPLLRDLLQSAQLSSNDTQVSIALSIPSLLLDQLDHLKHK